MPSPLRVPLTELKKNPGAYLESARSRRVLLTRRGRVVGELVPMDEAPSAPVRPLLGCGSHLVALEPGVDLTEPVGVEWEAAR
jgi:prevent-host-death family protein